ncbi:hypothetical protein PR048_012093 [Dryococelus australis]|uniref:Uncharacterized protein n=1 Tax=Dryococelus australis TaxID=614101 RepID=A0ABQ9HNG9_9NEOP|nr:hypothetical protein PR048_012093 [Dryococelus australis]
MGEKIRIVSLNNFLKLCRNLCLITVGEIQTNCISSLSGNLKRKYSDCMKPTANLG